MGLKVYKSAAGVKINFLVNKEDKTQVLISFRGSNKSYQTKDAELQKLIEKSRYFEGGNIILEGEQDGSPAEDIRQSTTDYLDIVEFQDAVDFLVKNHGAKEATLKTPAALKKAADGFGVSFPNLKV